jgi:GDP-L-fucose synthase
MDKTARIFVAGHRGLIGSAVLRRLRSEGYENLLLCDRSVLELTDTSAVDSFFEKERPEYVVLAAGRVGGIVENQTKPVEFLNTNLAIQLNVLKTAHRMGVQKLVLFGSSCMYPRECAQPMPETLLLSGKPEPTSLAYAISKLAGVQMCLAYNQQYGEKRFIPVIPNSAFGPHDNFDLKSAHVLSSLIRRFHEAKQSGAASVTLWGSGTPRREFVYVDDIADACLWLLTHDITNLELPVNVGIGKDHSIRELAEAIAGIVGYKGKIEWDTSKPDGAPRKMLDSSRMLGLGWKPKVDLAEGLKRTYEWYLEHIASLQGGKVSV